MAQPGTPQDPLQAAEALLTAKRFRDACTSFARLAESGVHSSDAHRGQGRALAKLGNYDEAAACYEKAIEANPADARTYGALRKITGSLSDLDALIARVQLKIEDIGPAAAHAAWANFLIGCGRTQLALAECQMARRHRCNAATHLRWSHAWARLKRYEEALDHRELAIPIVCTGNEPGVNPFCRVPGLLMALGMPANRIARI